MQITGKLPTSVENVLSCFLYFQQMSNGKIGIHTQGDAYDHLTDFT